MSVILKIKQKIDGKEVIERGAKREHWQGARLSWRENEKTCVLASSLGALWARREREGK